MNKKKYLIALLLSLIIILTIYFLPYTIKLKNENYRNYLISQILNLKWKGPFVLIILFAFQLIVPILPGEPFEIISGIIYGPLLGMLYAQIGIFIGSLLVIWTIRSLNLRINIKKYPKWVSNILCDKTSLNYSVFFITLIPGLPKDIIPYMISQTYMKIKDYLIINFLARIPSIISSTIVGSSLFNGHYKLSLIIFLAELFISILCLIFKKRIIKIFKHKNKIKYSSNNIDERND